MSDVMEWRGHVKVIGGPVVNEEYRRAMVTRLGDEFKLSVQDGAERRLRQVDRLTEAKMTVGARGIVTITGISEMYVNEVGLPATEEAAGVRWEMRPQGCQGCR